MSKFNLMTLITLFLTFSFAIAIPSYVPQNGLVGWWSFNGNANDESVTGNNASVVSATLTTDRFGKTNSAYEFNQSYILINNNSAYDYIDFSVSLWVSSTFGNLQVALKQGNYSNAEKEKFSVAFNDLLTESVQFAAKYNSCLPGVGWVKNEIKQTNLYDGIFHHIVGTVKSDSIKLYIDGVLVKSIKSNFSQSASCFGGEIQIGRQWANGINYFKGKIDDVGIWNRSLTNDEVLALFESHSYELTGNIVDEQNKPINNIVINLSGNSSTTTLSDSNGLFQFNNLPSGTYTIIPEVTSKLYFSPKSKTISITNTNINQGLDFVAITKSIPEYVPQNGLVGWWPFNNNANDESGNENHGVVNGSILSKDRFENENSAYTFNQSHILIKNSQTLNFDNVSVSVWIKTSNKVKQVAVKQGNYSNANFEKFSVAFNDLMQDGAQFAAKYNSCSPGIGWEKNELKQNVFDNKYHHIVGTVQDDSVKLYVDGNLVKSIKSNFSKSANCSGGDIQIGREWSNGINYFIGDLDDIGIWNRALTSSEISKLFYAGRFMISGQIKDDKNNPVPNISVKLNGDLITQVTTDLNGLFQFNNLQSGTFTIIPEQTNTYSFSPQSKTISITNSNISQGLDFVAITKSIPEYVPQNGLVGWWPFNSNANDESGNENHGVVNGSILSKDRFGKDNSAYSFNQSHIFIKNSKSLEYVNFSVSVWINTSNNVRQIAIKQNNYANAEFEIFSVAFNDLIQDGAQFAVKYNSCSPGVGWEKNELKQNIFDNKYHHLVGTVQDDSVKLYVDGNLVKSIKSNFSKSANCSGGDIQFGREWSSKPNYFKGDLDDIGIWNRALTQTEIELLCKADGFVISGQIKDDANVPISNTTVQLIGTNINSTQTDLNGNFKFPFVKKGTYILKVVVDSSLYNTPSSQTITIDGNNTTEVSFNIEKLKYYISGKISDENSVPMSNLEVNLSGTKIMKSYTNTEGSYTFTNLTNGIYIITPLKTNSYTFTPESKSITINGASVKSEMEFLAVKIINSIQEISQNQANKIFYDNFQDEIIIRNFGANEISNVKIFNSCGLNLFESDTQQNSSISTKSFTSGLYFIIIDDKIYKLMICK